MHEIPLLIFMMWDIGGNSTSFLLIAQPKFLCGESEISYRVYSWPNFLVSTCMHAYSENIAIKKAI